MKTEFEMSLMGDLTFFLGLQVNQTNEGIFISQTKYVKELLKRFDYQNLKHSSTPIAINAKLEEDPSGKSVDPKTYRGMIGSLLYLTTSRPDIQFCVCLCARFQSNPKESHMLAVKRIFKYLVGTCDLGIWYPAGCKLELFAYCDADYAGCKLDRKSTSGLCVFLGGCLISWASKKQHSVALSTAEAEYVAAGRCGTQILWVKHQLLDYNQDLGCVPILCDNTSAINLSKNPIQHSRTKHIEIRHHFLRDEVAKKSFELHFIETEKQIADIFTKPLPENRFSSLRRELGLCKCPPS